MDFFQAIVLGIVEGLTEFLPISSTGHMILAGHFLGVEQDSDFVKTFEISIQLGSILAVLFVLYHKLFKGLDIWLKLCVGFVPTGLIGFLAYKYVREFFTSQTVAVMLIIGGIIFLLVEYRQQRSRKTKKDDIAKITYKEAFIIGLCQCFAMIPGTSRSGATIVAGLLMGFSRTLAAEFSFMLAIPTMFAATGYDIYKNLNILDSQNLAILFVGGVVAFISALLSIKLFLRFVSRFSYISFGYYRILIGVIFLFYFWQIHA
ncbi:undecaprenyl-diphosphate phosphatase [Helicobacter sp. faydin-H20]|uniref:undecaprenyl-diphosphate phosphatase n=1 Tax=Helicobacter anatolicus TaxID=2905874 RepID=UPI001E5697A5|nr:undecaprenyl-diphosphate phosphatase [Helicobacter anatolicus]MCE3036283.1 undecaprenyl-diphosphate phosphatase [Helicobacter anatolicus]